MDSTRFTNFFLNYFLFNYIIIKNLKKSSRKKFDRKKRQILQKIYEKNKFTKKNIEQ
jgi:hypothetical protein